MSAQMVLRVAPGQPSFLGTRRGKLTLVFLCMVGFLDFVDASIVNVALPTIRHDLRFSVQSLQWVLSGYLLTYGGFMLLGGRAADLLGRPALAGPRRRLGRAKSLVPPPPPPGGPGGRLAVAAGRPPRPGFRRGDDAARHTFDPDHDLPRGQGPERGARRLGRDRRARLRG